MISISDDTPNVSGKRKLSDDLPEIAYYSETLNCGWIMQMFRFTASPTDFQEIWNALSKVQQHEVYELEGTSTFTFWMKDLETLVVSFTSLLKPGKLELAA